MPCGFTVKNNKPSGRNKMRTAPPRISVVTVVFNGEAAIAKTLQSVADQDFEDFEYIVIDGKSTDRTLDRVREAGNLVTEWVSEPDAGIYDAMNKGIRKARGDYLYFLNAGDAFCGPSVLSQASKHLQENPAVLVGRVAVHGGVASHFPLGLDDQFRSDARKVFASHFCHQALFVCRQDLIATDLFSLEYPRFADFHSAWRVMSLGQTLYVPDLIISDFSLDGVSSDWRKAVDLYLEKERMLGGIGFGLSGLGLVVGYLRAVFYKLKMSIKTRV